MATEPGVVVACARAVPPGSSPAAARATTRVRSRIGLSPFLSCRGNTWGPLRFVSSGCGPGPSEWPGRAPEAAVALALPLFELVAGEVAAPLARAVPKAVLRLALLLARPPALEIARRLLLLRRLGPLRRRGLR